MTLRWSKFPLLPSNVRLLTASRPYACHAQPFYPSRMAFHFHSGQATGLCGGQFCLWHPGPGYFHRSRVVRLAAVPVLSATAKNLTGAVGEDNHCHAMAVEQEVQNSAIEQEDPPMSLYVRIALLSLEPPRCVAGCNLEWPPCHHLSPYDVCRLIPLEAWQRQQPCYLEPRD